MKMKRIEGEPIMYFKTTPEHESFRKKVREFAETEGSISNTTTL